MIINLEATMLKNVLNKFDIKTVSAHCDIPCKIYDPISAQLAAISVVRFIDILTEINASERPLSDEKAANVIRLVREKEIHAEKTKHEIRVIWGDYMKTPQFEKFPKIHEITHEIMMLGSKCKQSVERQHALDLLDKVNEFAEIFWQTKNVGVYRARAPYPPALEMVYPDLK